MKMRAKLSKREKCPECGNQALIHDNERGESVCSNCGLVVLEKEIDKGPEWRAFSPEERAKRVRGTSSLEVSTTLDPHGRDALGRKIPLSQRKKMQRLRMWQRRSILHHRRNRNFGIAERELNHLCEALHLPLRVKDLARKIYRSSFERDLIRGRSTNTMVAAAIALACRQLQIPRSLDAIAGQSQSDKNEIARDVRLLIKELKLRNPTYDMAIFINQIGGNLGLSQKTQQLAFDILNKAKEKKITAGKGPRGLVAAALYIACLERGEKKTQREISEVSGVTEVTIRNRYQGLKKNLGTNLGRKKELEPKPEKVVLAVKEKSYSTNFAAIRQCLKSFSNNLLLFDHLEKDALEIAKKAFDRGLLADANPALFALACIDIACLAEECPISTVLLSEVGKVEEKEITKCSQILIEKMNLKVPGRYTVFSIAAFKRDMGVKTKDFSPKA